MEYAEFDAERRRIVRAWGREISDPEQLAAAVDRLREQAESVPGQDQARALRHLQTLDDLVTETRAPESETVRRAADVLTQASRPGGTAAERRTRAEAGMAEISRIADAAPSVAERDAALEMNESLAETVASWDGREAPALAGRPEAEDPAARFAADSSIAPAGGIQAPNAAAVAGRTAAATGPKAPIRDR